MYIKLALQAFLLIFSETNKNFAYASQWQPYINVPNCTTKAISTEFYSDRRMTFYICQRQKVIKKG